jgi:hypothetical protein
MAWLGAVEFATLAVSTPNTRCPNADGAFIQRRKTAGAEKRSPASARW